MAASISPAPRQSPASAESGFMLSPLPLENQFVSDEGLQRILSWYLPSDLFKAVVPELTALASEATSERIQNWVSNAEKQQPYVKTHNVWGRRYDVDRPVTSDGWKQLGKWGAQRGVVATGYEPEFGDHKRIVEFAKTYIYVLSSALNFCPVSMSDGGARLLSLVARDLSPSHPFHEAFARLISRDNHWTSGQWMTERAGGSDVQNSETWARYSPLPSKTGEHGRLDEGDYLVSGFKFFSSATDANIAFLLAKTESGKLSTFLAPLKKRVIGPDGQEKLVTNGVRIHRLKNKLGTKQLPTAELELRDMRAHLVGPLDRGVPTIAHLLNVTRTYTFMSSAALWRRAIAIAKSFAKARTTIDQPLWTLPLHLRTFADIELKHRAALHLSFFTVALISFTENSFPESSSASSSSAPLPCVGTEAEVVLRALTATAKGTVTKTAISCVQECMESMGGVGFLDEADEPEFNIACIYRDVSVNAIWEGTTNVLSSELVRHLLKANNLAVFAGWIQRAIRTVHDKTLRNTLDHAWLALQSRLVVGRTKARLSEVLGDGRRVMFSVAWVVTGLLLTLDAQREHDLVAGELARRWVLNAEGGGEAVLPDLVQVNSGAQLREEDDNERVKWDCRLVWGVELPAGQAATGFRGSAKL